MSGLQWDKPTTVKLLQLVADDPAYRYTLFGKSLYRGVENRKWVATRDLCLIIFQEEAAWIAAMRARKLVKRQGGKWVATDQWTSKVNDPVKSLLGRLDKEMDGGFFLKTYGIDPKWTKWEDIPDKRKRDSFKRAYPHYFILHDLKANPVQYQPLPNLPASRSSCSQRDSERPAPSRARSSQKRMRSSSPIVLEPYAKRGKAAEEEDIKPTVEELNSRYNPVVVDDSPSPKKAQLPVAGPGPSTTASRAKEDEERKRKRQLPSPSPTPSASSSASSSSSCSSSSSSSAGPISSYFRPDVPPPERPVPRPTAHVAASKPEPSTNRAPSVAPGRPVARINTPAKPTVTTSTKPAPKTSAKSATPSTVRSRKAYSPSEPVAKEEPVDLPVDLPPPPTSATRPKSPADSSIYSSDDDDESDEDSSASRPSVAADTPFKSGDIGASRSSGTPIPQPTLAAAQSSINTAGTTLEEDIMEYGPISPQQTLRDDKILALCYSLDTASTMALVRKGEWQSVKERIAPRLSSFKVGFRAYTVIYVAAIYLRAASQGRVDMNPDRYGKLLDSISFMVDPPDPMKWNIFDRSLVRVLQVYGAHSCRNPQEAHALSPKKDRFLLHTRTHRATGDDAEFRQRHLAWSCLPIHIFLTRLDKLCASTMYPYIPHPTLADKAEALCNRWPTAALTTDEECRRIYDYDQQNPPKSRRMRFGTWARIRLAIEVIETAQLKLSQFLPLHRGQFWLSTSAGEWLVEEDANRQSLMRRAQAVITSAGAVHCESYKALRVGAEDISRFYIKGPGTGKYGPIDANLGKMSGPDIPPSDLLSVLRALAAQYLEELAKL